MAEITIEIESLKKPQDVLYDPLHKTLRGRLRQANLPPEAGQEIRQWGDIPGIHLAIDLVKRSLRVYDPVREDEVVRAKAQKACLEIHGTPNFKCLETIFLERLSDVQLATNLWHMRMLVEDGYATLHAGVWPKDLPTGPWPMRGDFPTPGGPEMYPMEPPNSPYNSEYYRRQQQLQSALQPTK